MRLLVRFLLFAAIISSTHFAGNAFASDHQRWNDSYDQVSTAHQAVPLVQHDPGPKVLAELSCAMALPMPGEATASERLPTLTYKLMRYHRHVRGVSTAEPPNLDGDLLSQGSAGLRNLRGTTVLDC